jgi:hypothetical protein
MLNLLKFIYIFFILLLFACKSPESEICENTFSSEPEFVLDKFVGTWKNNDGIHFERWKKIDSTHFLSDVFRFDGKDTVFLEMAKIYYLNQKWNFENWVKGQNENKKVIFEAETWEENYIAFKNPTHDFPTEIHYQVISDSILKAFIVGKNEDGMFDTFDFNYQRID